MFLNIAKQIPNDQIRIFLFWSHYYIWRKPQIEFHRAIYNLKYLFSDGTI